MVKLKENAENALMPRKNLVEISNELFWVYTEFIKQFEGDFSIDGLDSSVQEFIVEIQTLFPNLPVNALLRQFNIISAKVIRHGISGRNVNPDTIRDILKSIHKQLPQEEECIDSDSLEVAFNLSISLLLSSFEEESGEAEIHSLVAQIGDTFIITGVVHQSLMESFQSSIGGTSGDAFAYLDGSGLAGQALVNWGQTRNGKWIKFDHHQLKELNNPATIELYHNFLNNICKIIPIVLDKILEYFSFLEVLLNNDALKSSTLRSKLLIHLFENAIINNTDNNISTEVLIDSLINMIKAIINQPDPDALGPIAMDHFVAFWVELFSQNEFNSIDIENVEERNNYLTEYFKKYTREYCYTEVTEVVKTAITNSFSDINYEIIEMEFLNKDPESILLSQLNFLLSNEFKNLNFTDVELKYLNQVFSKIILKNYDEATHSNRILTRILKHVKFRSVDTEDILKLFNRFFVYRERSKELVELATKAIADAKIKIDEYIQSKLFNNTLVEVVEIYELANSKAKALGAYDFTCLYAIESFLEIIKIIVKAISLADARGGVIPYMYFEEVEPLEDGDEIFSLEHSKNPLKTKNIAISAKNQNLSISIASVANHVHSYIYKTAMDKYRKGDYIGLHAEFGLHVSNLLSLLLAFKNSTSHFREVTRDDFPLLPITYKYEDFYEIHLSPHNQIKVLSYSQSSVPKGLNYMDRTLLMNIEKPDLFVIYIGNSGLVGFYNYTIILTNHDKAEYMNGLLNFITIFTTHSLSDLSIQNIDQNIDIIKSIFGSTYGSTGSRTIGLPFKLQSMQKLIDLYSKLYASHRNNDFSYPLFLEQMCGLWIEISNEMLSPEYHMV
jgi:hypothetical protein